MSLPVTKHKISLVHALDGLAYAFKTQPNFRVHLFVTALVIFAGYFFRLNNYEWLVVVFAVNMVMVAEMLNTSIESITDLITKEYRQEAKVAKDVSAGMVFVSALLSVIVGLIIFGPKIISLIK